MVEKEAVMRAFLCVAVRAEIRSLLKGISDELRMSTASRASWVVAENYHVTVQFLGEIDPMLTVPLQRGLEASVSGQKAFDVMLDRISGFPSPERPRVLWAGGAASAAFGKLVCAVSQSTQLLGFPRERQPDVFHITLARIRGAADARLVKAIGELSHTTDPTPINVTGVTLMESRLTKHGAKYNRLFEVPLRGERGTRAV